MVPIVVPGVVVLVWDVVAVWGVVWVECVVPVYVTVLVSVPGVSLVPLAAVWLVSGLSVAVPAEVEDCSEVVKSGGRVLLAAVLPPEFCAVSYGAVPVSVPGASLNVQAARFTIASSNAARSILEINEFLYLNPIVLLP